MKILVLIVSVVIFCKISFAQDDKILQVIHVSYSEYNIPVAPIESYVIFFDTDTIVYSTFELTQSLSGNSIVVNDNKQLKKLKKVIKSNNTISNSIDCENGKLQITVFKIYAKYDFLKSKRKDLHITKVDEIVIEMVTLDEMKGIISLFENDQLIFF